MAQPVPAEAADSPVFVFGSSPGASAEAARENSDQEYDSAVRNLDGQFQGAAPDPDVQGKPLPQEGPFALESDDDDL